MFKRKWLIAAAGATLVVVLGAGGVMAQSATGNGTGSTFLDRVAQKLGIDTPKLQKAITDTRNEDVDAAVQNGDLTQKQADALKQRIQNMPGFGGRGFGGSEGLGRGGPKGFGPGFEFGLGMGLSDASQKFADFLGITTDQLKTELGADNATIATVAAAHGKSRDQVTTFVTDGAKTALDAAVKNGDLTQKREDAALKMLSDNLDKLLDGKFGLFFRGGFGGHKGPGGAKPGNNATPNTPAPQSGSGTDGTQSF
jgi:uncharacterized protein YidB (DUF937 family)